LLGQVSKDRVAEMLHARLRVIIPSIWYEGFPLAVVEAFAAGVPVIASNIGVLGESAMAGPDCTRGLIVGKE
jgi:glycosyltransferase involved in cell wall biosynthesis